MPVRRPLGRARAAVAALLAALGVVGAVGVPGTPVRASAGDPNEIVGLLVEGVGFGHGRGMSQWGAYGRAVNAGQSWTTILDAYFGGTVMGDVANAPIGVRLLAMDGVGTVGVVSSTASLRVAGSGQSPSATAYRSMYARQTSGNSFEIFGSTASSCPGATALSVPNGPLSSGARGGDVTALQRVLSTLGHNPGPIDGIFGQMTDSAVRAFQSAQNLAVTGTWTSTEATRARQLISTGDTGTSWQSLGTVTGPVTFSTDVNTSTAAPDAVIGVCTPSGTVTHYRGSIGVLNDASTPRTVNVVALEDYVRGVVPREMSPSWGSAGNGAGMNALRAQAVAARSYALAQNRYSYAKTCDSQACQVYGGAARRAGATGVVTVLESAATDRAVADTAGKVRTRNGTIMSTEYSASNGPRTAGGTFPAVDDPFDDVPTNPNHRWTRIIPAGDVAARYNLGRLTAARTETSSSLTQQGFGGIWANEVRLTGTTGSSTQTTWNFRGAFGLPSPGYTVTPITRSLAASGAFAMIGDSITASITDGAGAPLPALLDRSFASVRLDGVVGRCTVGSCSGGNGVAAAQNVPQDAALVVVQLGYNDGTLDAAKIDQMMGALRARGAQRVAWVNVSERRTSSNFARHNQALREATSRWSELQVWDWNAISSGVERNRWFTDSVHLTATGRAEFSRWIRTNVLTAMGVAPADPGPTPPAPGTPAPSPSTPPPPPPTVIPAGYPLSTIAGPTRYDTSAALIAATFTTPVARVLLVSGEDYPDGLAASGAAGLDRIPVLLTSPTGLAPSTAAELNRLSSLGGPKPTVVLVGGPAAITSTVERQVAALGHPVERVAGVDRYATAAAVASAFAGRVGTTVVAGREVPTAIIATGQNFPDALSAGAGAYHAGLPLLLTRPSSLPDATRGALDALGIERVIVVGGRAAVSEDVVAALAAGGRIVERAFGADRGATAAAFAQLVIADRETGGLAGGGVAAGGAACADGRPALVVDAQGFADALSAGAAAGLCGAPILLSGSSATTAFLEAQRAEIARVVIVGGRVRVA